MANSLGTAGIRMGRVYTAEEICVVYGADIFARRFHQFYVPTEVVVSSPQMVVPHAARAYATGLWVLNRRPIALTSEGRVAAVRRGQFTYGDFQDVHLFEYVDTHGSDGHVEYHNMGFVFGPASLLSQKNVYRSVMQYAEDHRDTSSIL